MRRYAELETSVCFVVAESSTSFGYGLLGSLAQGT